MAKNITPPSTPTKNQKCSRNGIFLHLVISTIINHLNRWRNVYQLMPNISQQTKNYVMTVSKTPPACTKDSPVSLWLISWLWLASHFNCISTCPAQKSSRMMIKIAVTWPYARKIFYLNIKLIDFIIQSIYLIIYALICHKTVKFGYRPRM